MAEKATELSIVIRARNAAREALDQLGRQFDGLKSTAAKWGAAVSGFLSDVVAKARNVALAIGGISAAGVKMASDLERDMANVANLMDNVTGRQLKSMTREVQNISVAFNQTNRDASKALFDIVSAGFQGASGMKVLEQSAKLAVAGVTDIKNASNLLTSALNAYRLSADDAQRVSDIFFAGQVKGKTTIEEMANAMGRVLPTAKTAGVSLEELTGTIATMTASGLDTNHTVTATNALLMALVNPSDQAVKAINRLGLEFKNADGTARPLLDVFKQLQGFNLETLGQIVPDREAVVGLANIVNNIDKLEENFKALNNTVGATGKAFERMEETGSLKIGRLGGTIKKALTDWGVAIMESDAFKIGLDFITRKFTGFTKNLEDDTGRLKVGINVFALSVIQGFTAATRAVGFFAESVSVGLATVKLAIAGSLELSRITANSLSVNKTEELASTRNALSKQLEYIVSLRKEIEAMNAGVAAGDPLAKLKNFLLGDALRSDLEKGAAKFHELETAVKGLKGELDAYDETQKGLSGLRDDFNKGTLESLDASNRIAGFVGKLTATYSELSKSISVANGKRKEELALQKEKAGAFEALGFAGPDAGFSVLKEGQKSLPVESAKKQLQSNFIQIQQFSDELNRLYAESGSKLAATMDDRISVIDAEYSAELTKLSEFQQKLKDLNVKDVTDRTALESQLQKIQDFSTEAALRKKELLNLETNKRLTDGVQFAYDAQYTVARDGLDKQVSALRNAGAEEIDLNVFKNAQLSQLRKTYFQAVSADEAEGANMLAEEQGRSLLKRVADETLFYLDRLGAAQQARRFLLQNDRLGDADRVRGIKLLNDFEQSARLEQLERYKGTVFERINLETQFRDFAIQNNSEISTADNARLEAVSRANTDTLLKMATDESLHYNERSRLLNQAKDRNLDMFQALSLAHLTFTNESRLRWVEVTNFALGAFAKIQDSISKMFFDPMTGKFLNFKDGIEGMFQTIRDSFFQMLADMAARLAVSGLLNLGSKLLGFASGGVIPEDGLFAGQKGEAVLTRDAVGLLGKEAISSLNGGGSSAVESLGNSVIGTDSAGAFAPPPGLLERLGSGIKGISDSIGAFRAGLQESLFGSFATKVNDFMSGLGSLGSGIVNAGAGFLGDFLASKIVGGGTAQTIGSTAGAIAGTFILPGIGTFLGSFGGGLLGGLFGGGETLNPDEEAFYPAFAQLKASRPDLLLPKDQPGHADIELIMALTRLAHPNTGADSISDSFRLLGGGGIGEDEIDDFTRRGLRDIVDRGIMTRQEMEDQMVLDMGIFKPGAKLDYLGEFDRGGVLKGPGLFRVGNIAEAMVPLADGRNIPVRIERGNGDDGLREMFSDFLDELRTAIAGDGGKPVQLVVNLDGREVARSLVTLGARGVQTAHPRGVYP